MCADMLKQAFRLKGYILPSMIVVLILSVPLHAEDEANASKDNLGTSDSGFFPINTGQTVKWKADYDGGSGGDDFYLHTDPSNPIAYTLSTDLNIGENNGTYYLAPGNYRISINSSGMGAGDYWVFYNLTPSMNVYDDSSTPTSHDFGSLQEESTSYPREFTIKNDGDWPITIATITNSDPAHFEITDDPTGENLAEYATTSFKVKFKSGTVPGTTPVSQSSTIVISATSNNGAVPSKTISVSGTTMPDVPGISVSTGALTFTPTAIGTPVSSLPTQSFSVSHVSGGNLTVTVTSSDTSKFSVVSPQSPFTLSSGNRSVNIRFEAPAPAGTQTGQITVVASAGGQSDTETVNLSGESYVPTPEACYSTGMLDFESVNTGTSKSSTFTVTNCGTAPLQIQSVVLNSSDPPGIWSITPSVPPVVTVPPSPSTSSYRDFTVRLSVPSDLTSDVSYSGTVTVTTNDGVNSPIQTINLSGTGHLPVPIMRVASTTLDYHEVETGFAFTKAVLIYNDGDAPLDVSLQIHPDFATDPNLVHWQSPDGSLDLRTATIPSAAGPEIFKQVYAPKGLGQHIISLQATAENMTPVVTKDITLMGEGIGPVPMDCALVLDRSGSMSGLAGAVKKINAMRTAADLFAHLLAQRNVGVTSTIDKLGFVKYNQTASTYMSLGLIDAAQLNTIETDKLSQDAISDIALDKLYPKGLTTIGGAMQCAGDMLVGSAADRKHIMVLLTDGIETTSPWVDDVMTGVLGADPKLKVYSVGLGNQHDPVLLQQITNVTNGYHQVQEDLSGLDRFDLETFYFKIFANAADMSLAVDPVSIQRIDRPKVQVVSTATVSSSDQSAFFVVLEIPELRTFYDLELVSPQGNVIVPGSTVGGVPVHQLTRLNYRIFHVIFPDKSLSETYVGDWILRLTPNGKWSRDAAKRIIEKHDIIVSSLINPVNGYVPVGFAAAVSSDYCMKVNLLTDSYLPGAKVKLTAALTDRAWPAPDGRVELTVTTPNRIEYAGIKMYDDGTHGDDEADDAVFSTLFPNTGQTGSYKFFFHGVGRNDRGELNSRQEVRYLTLSRPRVDKKPGDGRRIYIPCPVQWIFGIVLICLLLWLLFLNMRYKYNKSN